MGGWKAHQNGLNECTRITRPLFGVGQSNWVDQCPVLGGKSVLPVWVYCVEKLCFWQQ